MQMEATFKQLEEDEERFHKLQLTDQANFNDRLDTLQVQTIINLSKSYSIKPSIFLYMNSSILIKNVSFFLLFLFLFLSL